MAEEREAARRIIKRLPDNPLLKGKVTTEDVSWDDPDAPIGMSATLTPQQAVDRGLPKPSECDLTVVIFWGRMGTPLTAPPKPDGTQYLSGTEYEFDDAKRANREIFVYRRLPHPPIDIEDAEGREKLAQRKLVDAFFAQFRNPDGSASAGWNRYGSVDEFRDLIEAHIQELVNRVLEVERQAETSARGATSPRPRGKPIVPAEYRRWLQAKCASVELLGLQLKQGQAVRLNNVYVPLTTTASPEDRPRREDTPRVDLESAPVLLDRVGAGSLYISGDPGSGKSTFCRWLAWLTCEGAVPAVEIEPPDEYRERFPASLSRHLPILVPLREFWSHLPERVGLHHLTAGRLGALVVRWLEERNAPGLDGDLVAAHLEHGTALFIFDGIDEVPPARREPLLAGLQHARDVWTRTGSRLVVTSRPYGLSEADVRRLGLPHAPIRQLPEQLQLLLVRRWFRILCERPEEADATASEMLRQVQDQKWLAPLTDNPLLLTAMCIVFGEGKHLPEDKHELYDRVVDTVLHNRIPDRQRLHLVRGRLTVVAHGMHTGDGLGDARPAPQAEVTDAEIDRMLRAYQERSSWTEQHVRTAFEDRYELVGHTGLLLPRGEHRAAFLHLSFQEFLAAQRLADVEGTRLLEIFLERSGMPEWRNTLSFLFGNLLATATSPERAVRLLADLVDCVTPDRIGLLLVASDATEILIRRGVRPTPSIDERLRSTCSQAMRGSASARDRCWVGSALGRIGDPRFRADVWWLPDDERLGFVEVGASAFTMGSDKKKDPDPYPDEQPVHRVELPRYFIGKFPVTVAQFRAFVEDPENSGFRLEQSEALRGVATHPVVHVSWHDAVAYCTWLTAKLRQWDKTPEPLQTLLRTGDGGGPWRVTLPSEAEWEKAARGTDGRRYPWGDEPPDINRANYAETGIDGPSAVGCFPRGATPGDGIADLGGNVWEWTRSLWGEKWDNPAFRYPYVPDPCGVARENLKAPDEVLRVMRGGAFLGSPRLVRAAFRYRGVPGDRDTIIGFRVVVSPFFSDL